jgi:hypothetical protein
MDTILQQPVAIPPDAGKVLKFLGVTHKLTGAQAGEPFIFVKQSSRPKAEVLYTSSL